MASKQIGLGTVTTVDDNDSGSVFTTVTLVVDLTPPARKRVRVDQTALADTLATNAAGIEMHSEYVFTQFWHPTDTVHAAIDTLFANKTSVIWNITYPFGTPMTDMFEGWVSDLEPQTIVADGMITRKVTIQRDTAITRT